MEQLEIEDPYQHLKKQDMIRIIERKEKEVARKEAEIREREAEIGQNREEIRVGDEEIRSFQNFQQQRTQFQVPWLP